VSKTLYAGAARRVINPPIGTGKTGIRLFGGPIQAIESDLTATALVLSDGETKVVILALDLAHLGVDISMIGQHPTNEYRDLIAAALRIPRSHVMINSSHNHSGPAMPGYMLDTDEDQTFKERYKRDLLRWLVEAAVEADRKLQPARIGADWGEATLAVYRREYQDGHDVLGEVPGHPIDPSVGVIRVDDLEGNPIAIVFRYSCHPVTIGGRSAVASTDYPGPARDVLERSLGGLAVFLQGCGGNINPTYGIGYEVDCRDIKMRMGLALGGEALKVASGIRTHIRPGARKPLGNIANILFTPWEPVSGETCTYLGAVEQDLPLEFGELPSLAQAEAVRTEKQQRLADLRSRNAAEWEIRVAETFDRWGEMLVASVKHGHPTCDLTIQAFRVNDIVIAGMNAEVFYETGLALRAQSPFKHTFINGYTNGTTYYLPRAEDYPPGGWKIDAAYAVPDMLFQFHLFPVAFRDDSEQRAVAATLGLLEDLSVP
jgi:hypothetical protein